MPIETSRKMHAMPVVQAHPLIAYVEQHPVEQHPR
jgi:hypothetical protein